MTAMVRCTIVQHTYAKHARGVRGSSSLRVARTRSLANQFVNGGSNAHQMDLGRVRTAPDAVIGRTRCKEVSRDAIEVVEVAKASLDHS